MSKSINLDQPSVDDAPIVYLLSKQPHEMSSEELDALITTAQSLATSAQKRRAAVSGNKAPKKSKLNLDEFL